MLLRLASLLWSVPATPAVFAKQTVAFWTLLKEYQLPGARMSRRGGYQVTEDFIVQIQRLNSLSPSLFFLPSSSPLLSLFSRLKDLMDHGRC